MCVRIYTLQRNGNIWVLKKLIKFDGTPTPIISTNALR